MQLFEAMQILQMRPHDSLDLCGSDGDSRIGQMDMVIVADIFLILWPDEAVQVIDDNAHLLQLRNNQRIARDDLLIDDLRVIPDRCGRGENDGLTHVGQNPRDAADGAHIVLVRREDAVGIQIVEQMARIPQSVVEVNDIRTLNLRSAVVDQTERVCGKASVARRLPAGADIGEAVFDDRAVALQKNGVAEKYCLFHNNKTRVYNCFSRCILSV